MAREQLELAYVKHTPSAWTRQTSSTEPPLVNDLGSILFSCLAIYTPLHDTECTPKNIELKQKNHVEVM